MAGSKRKKVVVGIVIAAIVLVAIVAFVVVFIQKNVKGAGYRLIGGGEGSTCTAMMIKDFYGFGDKETLTIPTEIGGKKVTKVDLSSNTQFLSDIKKVIIPEGVETIAENCFNGFKITEITLPKSIKEIGGGFVRGATTVHFEGNDKYELRDQCIIDKETKTIVNAFNGAKVPTDVENIANYAFASCTGLGEVDLSNVHGIGKGAFISADLTAVTIRNGAEVGDSAFKSSSVKDLYLRGGCSFPSDSLYWPFPPAALCKIHFAGTEAQFKEAFNTKFKDYTVVYEKESA